MSKNERPVKASGGDNSPYPVLVVPGWGTPHWHTRYIARLLEREGMYAIQLKFPMLGVGDMRDSAELLAEDVDATIEGLGRGKVNLVGYSLGGLIARIYLQELGGHRHLGRAVFVGAPQDGVYTAYPACFTKAGRQVIRGSGFMRDLNSASPCGCDEPKCLSIYLSRDVIILPSRSARLPCGYNMEMTWPVFHWGLVFSPGVVHDAAEFLKGNVPRGASLDSPAAAEYPVP